MRILVTGASGFAGGHLTELLVSTRASDLAGLGRGTSWPEELKHLQGQVPIESCDLTDRSAVEAVVRRCQPDQIFHLAGYAHAGQSFRESDAAWAGNLTATRRLYEAVERWGGRPRILSIGSGLVYGDPCEADHAHDEQCPLLPASPYAASKAAADLVGHQFARFPGLDIVRARPFNHLGPRQSPSYAVAHFARQIVQIERGRQPPVLETGNLTPARDFLDVRDVVRAYRLLMERGRTGEVYNIASGVARPIQAVLEALLSFTPVRVEVRAQGALLRASDIATVRGNSAKLRRETGWRPEVEFQQTLRDTLEYWRRHP